ncbi:MAG: glycosyltransferase [Candidatus Hadarchaeales archaeon]
MYPISDKPKISIIIPTLNEEKLIERTLKKAKEAAPGAEIIVVDGGSKDRTVEIAKKYARVLHSRGTIAAARNVGARNGKGEILLFLDADTILTKEFVDETLKYMKVPEVVGAGGMIMPLKTDIITEIVFYFFNILIMLSFFYGRPVLAGTCVAYKKKPFMEVGGFDEEMAASEDFDLCTRISKKGKVVFFRHIVIRTSRRRLEALGLGGLIDDWSRTTVQFLLGKKQKEYRLFH